MQGRVFDRVVAGCGRAIPTAGVLIIMLAASVAASATDRVAAKRSPASAAAALIGKTLPPYPDGLDEIQGTCIAGGDGLAHVCDFGLAALGVRRENGTAVTRYLVASHGAGSGTREPRWKVTDAVDVPRINTGYDLQIGGCRLDAVDDAGIAAIVRYRNEEVSSDVVWARRFDVATGRLVDVPAARVDCIGLGGD